MPERILVVDDDRAIRESLARALSLEGYVVDVASDGAAALSTAQGSAPDLYVLDVMMPAIGGLAVCRALRAQGDTTPILMLTARSETPDRIEGLEAGADDYLPKPFDLGELVARIRALLRRAVATGPDGPLVVGDLELDPVTRTVRRGDRDVALSKTEFALLELLMSRAGSVVHHDTIYQDIWGYDFGGASNNLAVYISYLRRKIDDGEDVKLIRTVRGIGYMVRA